MRLRVEHNIVCSPIGCSPAFPRQLSTPSLPCLLSHDDVTYLQRRGILDVDDCEDLKGPPSESAVAAEQLRRDKR